ncbi:MAG: ABC-2 family transporter protein [Myxococcota bacterium]
MREGSLSQTLKMAPTLLKVGFANMVAYRGEILIWILTTTMPLIMYALWSAVAEEAPLGRFDGPALASYFLAMLVVRQLSSAWVVWELNEQIRSGSLSVHLVRPAHPLVLIAAENLAAIPIRVLVLIPIVIAAVFLEPKMRFTADPLLLLLGAYATAMSWLLTYLIQSLVGLTALYTQQSLGIQDAYFGVWALCSGYFIPLELVPELFAIARWLPFRAVGGLPVEIWVGHLAGVDLALGLLAQAFWVVAAAITLVWFWPRAMRRFEAYGG